MRHRQLKITTKKVVPWKHDYKVASLGEGPESESEESPFPLLPSEGDVKQPAITSLFMKSPMKKETKKDLKKQGPKELKEKKKVTDETTKQDVRKLLPRKSPSLIHYQNL